LFKVKSHCVPQGFRECLWEPHVWGHCFKEYIGQRTCWRFKMLFILWTESYFDWILSRVKMLKFCFAWFVVWQMRDKMLRPYEEVYKRRPMEVCDICGAMLFIDDAPQRLDDHIQGKQHVGYARIRAYIAERQKKHEEVVAYVTVVVTIWLWCRSCVEALSVLLLSVTEWVVFCQVVDVTRLQCHRNLVDILLLIPFYRFMIIILWFLAHRQLNGWSNIDIWMTRVMICNSLHTALYKSEYYYYYYWWHQEWLSARIAPVAFSQNCTSHPIILTITRACVSPQLEVWKMPICPKCWHAFKMCLLITIFWCCLWMSETFSAYLWPPAS